MRDWIEFGDRSGLSDAELALRSGVTTRTIRRWSHLVHREQVVRAQPDEDGGSFVRLAELRDPRAPRIELVTADRKRIVIDGPALIAALTRLLEDARRC
jgi:hypothetical protein